MEIWKGHGIFKIIIWLDVASIKGQKGGYGKWWCAKDLECQAKKCGSYPESNEEFLELYKKEGALIWFAL